MTDVVKPPRDSQRRRTRPSPATAQGSEAGPSKVDVLVLELTEFARASSPLDLDRSKMPTLRAIAMVVTGSDSVTGVHSLVETASELLDEKPARALGLLFSDTEERWRDNLTTRKTAVARELGISYAKLRKGNARTGRPSPYDALLGQLAEAILESGETRLDHSGDTETGGSSSTRKLWVPAAAVVTALVIGGIFLIASRGGGARTESSAPTSSVVPEPEPVAAVTSTTAEIIESVDDGGDMAERALETFFPIPGCDIPLAGALDPANADTELTAMVRTAYEEHGGLAATGCPAHSFQEWGRLWYQEFEGPPGGSPVVLTVEPGTGSVVWMDRALFSTYQYAAYEKPQELAGMPVSATVESGYPVLYLSGGGVVVAQYPNGPGYWIPRQARDVWEQHGGIAGDLGVPMANVSFIDGRLHQDYAGGYLQLREDGQVQATLVDPDEAMAERSLLPRTTDGILRAYDGTAWWIDSQGRRSWIPDGDVWSCLGGDGAVISPEVPGYVLGTFPLLGTAECG